MKKIIYQSDADLLQSTIVATKEQIFGIEENEENFKLYHLDYFDKPSLSFINENDLKSLNDSCDTNYQFNEILNEQDRINFVSDLYWYYGGLNFDSSPLILTEKELVEFFNS
jgi:hypothetical protein